MTMHNPDNPLCDKTQYGDADGSIRCTCDVDIPDEGNVGPSVQAVPPKPTWHRGKRPVEMGTYVRPDELMILGRQAQLHRELEQATRDLDEAKRMLGPRETRWKQALDAYMEALLGR